MRKCPRRTRKYHQRLDIANVSLAERIAVCLAERPGCDIVLVATRECFSPQLGYRPTFPQALGFPVPASGRAIGAPFAKVSRPLTSSIRSSPGDRFVILSRKCINAPEKPKSDPAVWQGDKLSAPRRRLPDRPSPNGREKACNKKVGLPRLAPYFRSRNWALRPDLFASVTLRLSEIQIS